MLFINNKEFRVVLNKILDSKRLIAIISVHLNAKVESLIWLIQMKKYTKHRGLSRRDFLKYLIPGLSIPVIIWWLMVSGREKKISSAGKKVIIGEQIPSGINFLGSAVIINEGGVAKAFLAKCTHLGCSIRKSEGNEMICQCHGSRFNLSGEAIKGPAINPLKELKITQNPKSAFYEIIIEG